MFKKINKTFIFIICISLFIRLLTSIPLSVIIEPDSPIYIEHIQNICDGYGFALKDYTDNTIKPTAYRMPLFQYSVYLMLKILKLDKDKNLTAIKVINTLSSLLVLIFAFYIPYLITENANISILSFLLTLLNINLFYNSMLALTDTFFSFTVGLFILTALLAIKYKKTTFFLYLVSPLVSHS